MNELGSYKKVVMGHIKLVEGGIVLNREELMSMIKRANYIDARNIPEITNPDVTTVGELLGGLLWSIPFDITWIDWIRFKNPVSLLFITKGNDVTNDKTFECLSFADNGSMVIGPIAGISIPLKGNRVSTDRKVRYSYNKHISNDEGRYELEQIIYCGINRILSFLEAKNVKIFQCEYEKSTRDIRLMGKNGWKLKYHKITIFKPGKQYESISDGVELGCMPLHLCRGHIARYVDKGLFGKYFGTFYIPAHVRGNIKNGQVVKDYKLAGKVGTNGTTPTNTTP